MDDEPTKDLPDGRTTQPTMTAVFELVRELKQSVDATNARLDEMDAKFDGRFDTVSDEMNTGFTRLADIIERIRQHGELDYINFLRRIRELESKAS